MKNNLITKFLMIVVLGLVLSTNAFAGKVKPGSGPLKFTEKEVRDFHIYITSKLNGDLIKKCDVDGFTFNFSREFKSGLNMGVFFSLTDISKAEFGEGSFDKGFFFNIPIQVFFDQYSRGSSGFGLRPLTRDGAQALVHAQPLWSTTYQADKQQIVYGWDGFYD